MQDGDGSAIKAQIFDENGQVKLVEFIVNSVGVGDQTDPAIAVLDNSNFVVAWHGPNAIKAQIYDKDGGRVGSEITLREQVNEALSEIQITGLTSGDFVATWRDTTVEAEGHTGEVFAQVFLPDGMARGPVILAKKRFGSPSRST